MASSPSHPCPDYDGISEYGGPCWTCQNDPAHCPMFSAEEQAQREADTDIFNWWKEQQQ